MNIQTVADNLRKTIAGKEIQLAQWEAARSWKNADQQFVNETIQYLKINIDELKRILQDVEQCEPSLPGEGNNDSWITNPDRSGGQFTDEEINRAGEWR
jgi:hypothetical protein